MLGRSSASHSYTQFVNDWGNGGFYAGVLIYNSYLTVSVYFPDPQKSDDDFIVRARELRDFLGQARFRSCIRLVAGDFQVEFPPNQASFTGPFAKGRLRIAQQIVRVSELMQFLQNLQLQAASTFSLAGLEGSSVRGHAAGLCTWFSSGDAARIGGRQLDYIMVSRRAPGVSCGIYR